MKVFTNEGLTKAKRVIAEVKKKTADLDIKAYVTTYKNGRENGLSLCFELAGSVPYETVDGSLSDGTKSTRQRVLDSKRVEYSDRLQFHICEHRMGESIIVYEDFEPNLRGVASDQAYFVGMTWYFHDQHVEAAEHIASKLRRLNEEAGFEEVM